MRSATLRVITSGLFFVWPKRLTEIMSKGKKYFHFLFAFQLLISEGLRFGMTRFNHLVRLPLTNYPLSAQNPQIEKSVTNNEY